MNWLILENIFTICATAAIILGVWYMGGGAWAFIGFAMMININVRS